MLILAQKGQIWTKKGPKWAGPDFSRTQNPYFLNENHKISFYTNKTQYDWFPGKSQNSKKFHTEDS